MQLPAGEHEHALDVRLFAGSPGCREHRASARLDVHHAHRPPRDHDASAVAAVSATAEWSGRTPRAPARARAPRSAERLPSARAAREVLGPLRFTGRCRLARRLRPRRMRVVVERTLVRARPPRRARPIAARGAGCGRSRSGTCGDGLFTSRAARRATGAPAPAAPAPTRRARLDLRLTRVRTRDVRALCTVLPAGVSRAGRPLELETRLRLRDGARCTGGSPCASAGAACATARTSSPGSDP